MAKQKNKSPQSIVWMIDPFETKTAHRAPLAKTLKIFSRKLSQKVRPFSVVSPGGLPWPIPVSFPMENELREFGTETVRRDLKKLRMKGIQPPTVEVHESSSRSELVRDTLRFAKAQNAGYIAVNTRRLLSSSPLKVGGFAEALIGKSSFPIIAVSPKAKVSNQIKRILFPTDFTRESHQAFRKTLKLASRFGAKVELLNVDLPLIIPTTFPEMAIEPDDSYLKEAEQSRLKRNLRSGKRWTEEAKKAGVKCVYLSVSGVGSVAPFILQAAKRGRADLISLAGYRSSNTPAILGGIIREVLSFARTPVLEIHA